MTCHSFLVKTQFAFADDQRRFFRGSCAGGSFSVRVHGISSLYFAAVSAAAGILFLFPLSGCGHKPALAADQPVVVRLRAPKAVDRAVSVDAGGSAEANLTAMTAFEISGRVARVYVEEGQAVVKGQVLAELDPGDYQNAFDAAQGQAEAAKATDLKSENGLRPQELEQARIDFERVEDEYRRMKLLHERGSLADNDFHKYEAAFLASQQRYEMARQGTRKEEKLSAGAQARAAAAQMREARKHLEDCKLRAPITGFVGMRRVDVGNMVAAGTPVFSVVDLNPVKVRVAVPEAEIGRIQPGAQASVTIPSLNGQSFTGKLDALGVVADPASRTYTAKIAVENREHLLKGGMVAQARIFGMGRINVLTVPGAAIVRDERGVPRVFVYDAAQGRVFARRVEAGELIGDEVVIASGLQASDQVVVAGQQNVREGSIAHVARGGQ
jgi:multidrug efflux pump subunit AcrA (membrane-fusion protein)